MVAAVVVAVDQEVAVVLPKDSIMTQMVTKPVAFAIVVGITCVTLTILLFWVCDHCFPEEDVVRFVSSQNPLSWLGLIIAGIFVFGGRAIRGNALPVCVTRKAIYYHVRGSGFSKILQLAQSPGVVW